MIGDERKILVGNPEGVITSNEVLTSFIQATKHLPGERAYANPIYLDNNQENLRKLILAYVSGIDPREENHSAVYIQAISYKEGPETEGIVDEIGIEVVIDRNIEKLKIRFTQPESLIFIRERGEPMLFDFFSDNTSLFCSAMDELGNLFNKKREKIIPSSLDRVVQAQSNLITTVDLAINNQIMEKTQESVALFFPNELTVPIAETLSQREAYILERIHPHMAHARIYGLHVVINDFYNSAGKLKVIKPGKTLPSATLMYSHNTYQRGMQLNIGAHSLSTITGSSHMQNPEAVEEKPFNCFTDNDMSRLESILVRFYLKLADVVANSDTLVVSLSL